jgi:hypothetical protein
MVSAKYQQRTHAPRQLGLDGGGVRPGSQPKLFPFFTRRTSIDGSRLRGGRVPLDPFELDQGDTVPYALVLSAQGIVTPQASSQVGWARCTGCDASATLLQPFQHFPFSGRQLTVQVDGGVHAATA